MTNPLNGKTQGIVYTLVAALLGGGAAMGSMWLTVMPKVPTREEMRHYVETTVLEDVAVLKEDVKTLLQITSANSALLELCARSQGRGDRENVAGGS